MKQTLYDILGVAPDSSFEDIEVAYAKRFAVLRSETSWDSNRLVMLNEAREVLSDAGRRAAYDASLAVVPARARAHGQEAEIKNTTRSNGKWILFGAILVIVAFWLTLRDDPPPERSTAVPNGQSSDASDTSRQSLEEEETIEVQLPIAGESTLTPAAPTAPQGGADNADAPLSAEAVVDGSGATAQEAASATTAPIVGAWQCFDPVTGRNSKYAFAVDGRLTLQQAGSAAQTFSYEVANGQVKLVDANPPRAMGIGELSANKLILNGADEGRRIVCSR